MDDRPLEMSCLLAAMLAAFDLAEHFRQGHGAATIDERGRVVNLAVCARRESTIQEAIDWAAAEAAMGQPISRAVLFSVCEDVLTIREEDLETFARARAEFGARGIDLADWMQCDGTNVRSIAITTGLATWDDVSATGEGDRPFDPADYPIPEMIGEPDDCRDPGCAGGTAGPAPWRSRAS